jgi:FkbM family methyltransferase
MDKRVMNIRQNQALWSGKPSKLWRYAKDGTLYPRLYRWLISQQKGFRERVWDVRTAINPILPHKLETGATLRLYGDDYLCRDIFIYRFEGNERDFVIGYLAPGDIFIDVGANIGLFTLLGADVVGPTGKVYAFEPTATTYARLCDNVARNRLQHVECVPMALSDQDETRVMTVSVEGFAAWNSLAQPGVESRCVQEQVRCCRWDSFVAQHALTGKVALMKIDIEGWEFTMVQGAQATLQRADAPDLLVEFATQNAQSAGTTCVALYNLLLTLGYGLYQIDAGQRKLAPAVAQEYLYENLLATKTIAQVCRRTGYQYEGSA